MVAINDIYNDRVNNEAWIPYDIVTAWKQCTGKKGTVFRNHRQSCRSQLCYWPPRTGYLISICKMGEIQGHWKDQMKAVKPLVECLYTTGVKLSFSFLP